MNNKHPAMLVLIITGLFITACKNIPPVTSSIGSSQISPEQEYNENLQIDNKQLATKLYISNIMSRISNDLLQLNLALTSRHKKSLQLQYQFQWFDKEGFAIEAGKSPWQALELHGMQTVAVAGLAPSANVATFSIYVREVPKKFFKF